MSDSEEYRCKAKECLNQAKAAPDREMKASWRNAAKSWLRLADQAERLDDGDNVRPNDRAARLNTSEPVVRP